MLTTPQHATHSIFSRRECWGIGISILLTIGLGSIGYADYFAGLNQHVSLSDLLYMALGLFTFSFTPTGDIPWQLDVARWLAPLLLSYAAVKTIMLMLHSRLLLRRVRGLQNHAVVCGLDGHGRSIVQALVAKGISTVVIEPDPINVHLGWAANHGITVLTGNPRDMSNLIQANIVQAKYLLAFTEDDAINTEIIVQIYQLKLTNSSTPPLKSIAHVQNHELAAVLYDDAVFSKDYDNFSARVINMRQMAARWLLTQHGPDSELITEIATIGEIRILLLGSNEFVENLILRLAKLGHYGTSCPISITLAGPQAIEQLAAFNKHWPVLSEIIRIQAQDIELSFLNTQITQQLINRFKPSMIYVCATDTESTLIWSKALERLKMDCPVIVCQFSDDVLAKRIEAIFALHTQFKFVYPASAILNFDNIFNATQDQLAIAIHNNYVASQIAAGDTSEKNASLVDWDKLPETLKDANRNQADHLQIKCRVITGEQHCTTKQVEQSINDKKMLEHLAHMEHERWMAEKLLDGWQYTQGSKDIEARKSPSLITWEQLPESERQKDLDSVHNIPQLLQWIEMNKP